MKIHFEVSDYTPCTLHQFFINSIPASVDDFGHILCREPFLPKSPNEHVLNKYYITEKEYGEIIEKLAETFKTIVDCEACL